ncbi:MAG TPA: HD domain-containing phosphohydrolase [bacterium]|nr:HD domain-containing phosphohydrolase [bacterium]
MLPAFPAFYLSPYILAAIFPLVLGMFVWQRNRSPVGKTFSAMLLVQSAWSIMVLLEIVSSTLEWKTIWDDIQFLTSGASAILTLAFSIRYDGARLEHPRRAYALLMIFPMMACLFASTNPLHGLQRIDAFVDPSVPFGELVYTFRLPMLILLLPIYTMAVVAIVRLGMLAVEHRGTSRMSALCAFSGLLIPLVGTILTLAKIRINGRLEASSLFLMAGDAMIATGIFRYRMANILGTARMKIVENLLDPVMVIGHGGLIIYCNSAARVMFESAKGDMINSRADEFFAGWPEEAIAVLQGRSIESEAIIPQGTEVMDLSIRGFPINHDEQSRVVVVHDFSVLRKAERSLRELTTMLEKKVEEHVIDLEAEARRRRDAEERLSEINTEIEKTQTEVMLTLSEIIESRGNETARHVTRVSEYARLMGKATGMSDSEAELLANASTMHDIGKIGISDEILLDRGLLGDEERAILQSHPLIGCHILDRSDQPLIRLASRIALEHHERWNGSGYPDGKSGEAISLEARIVGICDVFDSLIAERSYREGWTHDRILEYFKETRGILFDPSLVDQLFDNLDAFLDITDRCRDDDGQDPGILQDIVQ